MIASLASFILVLLSAALYSSSFRSFAWLSRPPPPRTLLSPSPNSYSKIDTRSGNSSILSLRPVLSLFRTRITLIFSICSVLFSRYLSCLFVSCLSFNISLVFSRSLSNCLRCSGTISRHLCSADLFWVF